MYALFRINGFIMGCVRSPKCTQKNERFTGEVWKEKAKPDGPRFDLNLPDYQDMT